jgi:hypothetical protein
MSPGASGDKRRRANIAITAKIASRLAAPFTRRRPSTKARRHEEYQYEFGFVIFVPFVMAVGASL